MNINSITSQNKTNFKALKVATVKNLTLEKKQNFDIYKLRSEDYDFLQKLNKKINYKMLCPYLDENKQEKWQNVLLYCIAKAFKFGNITYLAVQNNRPCSIMTYYNDKGFHLDGICAIPNKEGKKTHLGGKVLFYQLFKDANQRKAKSIDLDAITDGPFDVIKKYEGLGFKNLGYKISACDSKYAEMLCSEEKIKAQLERLPNDLEYKEDLKKANLDEIVKF